MPLTRSQTETKDHVDSHQDTWDNHHAKDAPDARGPAMI
jgi:hypothetical protein